MNTTTQKTSKLTQKYLDIITSGTIEEGQIISMRSLMNKDKDAARQIFAHWEDTDLTLSDTQQQKGIEFLMNQWKSPRGTERKNNPFGYREQEILENVDRLVLHSLYNAGNAYHDNYLPLYLCYSKDGDSFEYYYDGKVQIVG